MVKCFLSPKRTRFFWNSSKYKLYALVNNYFRPSKYIAFLRKSQYNQYPCKFLLALSNKWVKLLPLQVFTVNGLSAILV
nr:MAG TPA: hypothetical protein [Caudoviricetes sp.]